MAIAINHDTQGKTTSLLDLPPEIWSKICKLVVERDRPINVYRFLFSTPSQLGVAKRSNVITQPRITKVCRAIRHECLPHYYKVNAFYSWHPSGSVRSAQLLEKWLTAIGRTNRVVLTTVFFLVHVDSPKERLLDLGDGKARVRELPTEEHQELAKTMEQIWRQHPVYDIHRLEIKEAG